MARNKLFLISKYLVYICWFVAFSIFCFLAILIN